MNTYCKKPLRLFARTGGAENAVNKKEKLIYRDQKRLLK
jgi:hypothetical protein